MLRRLLIADPDADQRRELSTVFSGGEFLVRTEDNGRSALQCVTQWRPECIILDVTLSGLTGLEVCRRIKADRQGNRIPVLMVSALRQQVLVNRSLSEGADDFLHKPCHSAELLWRVRGLLRRYESPAPPLKVLRRGPVEIDPEQGIATLSGVDMLLAKKELLLLEFFLRHTGRVLTRRFLLENIWGYDSAVRTRVVDLCVFQLRRKLGARWGHCLTTRRGFGYCLKF